MMFSQFDKKCMLRAFALARRAAGNTSPNPMVGAVLVSGGEVIGEGWHAKAGEAHAEEAAINSARAKNPNLILGATLYCTLEPCSFTAPDKKRPPCVNLLIENRVKRVVIAALDPNPRVNGAGAAALRAAGITVETGLLAEQDVELNRGFRAYQRLGRPYVHLKIAASLDGRIAAASGDSRWITGGAARKTAHSLRAFYDAVLVGRGCLAADNPSLTVRHVKGRNPRRVLLDSSLSVNEDAAILGGSPEEAAKTIIFCAAGASAAADASGTAGAAAANGASVPNAAARAAKIARLRERGVTVIPLQPEENRLPLAAVLRALGERGVRSVLVEGGGAVFGSFARENLWDRLSVFIAPRLLGEGAGALSGYAPRLVRDAASLSGMRVKRVGGDILIEGENNVYGNN